jgi:hypothetical protein
MCMEIVSTVCLDVRRDLSTVCMNVRGDLSTVSQRA